MPVTQNATSRLYLCLLLLAAISCGCGERIQAIPPKQPRPVKVEQLVVQPSPTNRLVSASVASWKTEQIGFQVEGRVEFVMEPNSEIVGRIIDKDGNELKLQQNGAELSVVDLKGNVLKATPISDNKYMVTGNDGQEFIFTPPGVIARLEDNKYLLEVVKAKAEVDKATENLRASQINLMEMLPAERRAAAAVAKTESLEFSRLKALVAQNAITDSELEAQEARVENANSNVAQVDAQLSAQKADVAAKEAELEQARQKVKDAERDLEDCNLFSSFAGQIADVAVVPGSVVKPGDPVATVQLMDPIKIEFEVSAADSRRLQQVESIPVYLTSSDGQERPHQAYVYQVDAVADAQTRTFTVTLLMKNDKINLEVPPEGAARTKKTWRLDFGFLPGAEQGDLFIEEDILLQDEEGYYLWKVTNSTFESGTPEDRIFKVERLPIKLGPKKIPFLANWVFQEVIVPDQDFDPEQTPVLGKLILDDKDADPSNWKGDTVILDSGGRWMLRPGDLVRVNISANNSSPGYFVPMDAIAKQGTQSFLFTVDGSGDQAKARKKQIHLVEVGKNSKSSSGLRKIEPIEGESLEGLRYITAGAHYLIDEEPVRVVSSTEED